MKRVFSLILCLILCAGLLPAAYAAEPAEAGDPAAEHVFVPGYVEPEVDVQYPAPAASIQGTTELPASYASKWVSPVKDQAYNGLCWGFTACALMETDLLRLGYGTYDLSEQHMGYATSNHSGNVYGEDRAPYDGGNREIASAYFMRGMPLNDAGQALCVGGFVSEADDPYNPNQLPDRSTDETFYGKPKFVMPKDAIYLCGSKTSGDGLTDAEMKGLVQTYGAVGASMYYDESAYNDSTSAFYLNWNPNSSNHAVTIVGWDDNYSRNNFSSAPNRDGAWLIKNSWGDWWGDEGYFWISYDDPIFPSYAWTLDGVIEYDGSRMQTYEYDYTCYDAYFTSDPGLNALYARFFEADKAGAVSSVQVFLPKADSTAEVDVIPVSDTGDLDAYSFQAKATRECHYAGWYTVDLPAPVAVESGTRFAVIVRCARGVGIDMDSNQVNSGLCWAGSWDFTEDAYGWCIKALVTTDILGRPDITDTGNTAAGKPTMTWDAVPGAAKYNVYRSGYSNGTYTKYYTTEKTSYTNTGATVGNTFFYKVCAVDENGREGPFSETVSIHCRPAAPKITSANGLVASGKPTLKWNAVPGAKEYVVYRSGTSTGTYTKMYTTTNTTYTNTSANAGYTYYYKVFAVDAKGYWSVASTVIGVRCRPAAPMVTGTINANGKPRLTWSEVAGADRYAIYRSTSPDGAFSEYFSTAVTSFNNTSAELGTTYYYKVYAVDARGFYSVPCAVISLTPTK